MKYLTFFVLLIISVSFLTCSNDSSLDFSIEIIEIDKEDGVINLESTLVNRSNQNLLLFMPIKGFTANDRIIDSEGEEFSYAASVTPAMSPDLYFVLGPGETYKWNYSIREESTGIPEVGEEPFKFEESETYYIKLHYWMSDYVHPSNNNVDLIVQDDFYTGNVESNTITVKY